MARVTVCAKRLVISSECRKRGDSVVVEDAIGQAKASIEQLLSGWPKHIAENANAEFKIEVSICYDR